MSFFANDDQDSHVWINVQFPAGDANRDGVFNSSGLILAFSAGEYENDIAGDLTCAEGDWDHDGQFGTADLVNTAVVCPQPCRIASLNSLPNLKLDVRSSTRRSIVERRREK
jgi:hypothetical protein